MADINARLPIRTWLELHSDGKVYQHTVKKGRYREYASTGTGRGSVCLGEIELIEKRRPDLIPKIRNYVLPENRGVVPVAERIKIEKLAFRISRIKDPAIIREMMSADKRKGAQAIYLRRLQKIEDIAAGIDDTAEEVEEVDEELVEAEA